MKKSKLFIVVLLGALVTVSAVGVFGGSLVSAADADVKEIVANPAAFDSQPVITEGIVTEWEIKEYTITITGVDFEFEQNFTVLRYYLVMQDLQTADVIRVRLNYRGNSPDLTQESFTIGETLLVEGVVKEFKFEADVEDLDIDLVILAKEIVREDGEVIVILTDADIEEFRAKRLEQRERRNTIRNQVESGEIADNIDVISAEVLQWDINEYNITVEGEDLYRSTIVVRPLLLVRNVETDATIWVKVNFPRMNTTLAEDFIAVGDIITIRGMIREDDFNSEFLVVESDEMMLAMSITNSLGEEQILVSRNAFMNAREQGHYRMRSQNKNEGLGERRLFESARTR